MEKGKYTEEWKNLMLKNIVRLGHGKKDPEIVWANYILHTDQNTFKLSDSELECSLLSGFARKVSRYMEVDAETVEKDIRHHITMMATPDGLSMKIPAGSFSEFNRRFNTLTKFAPINDGVNLEDILVLLVPECTQHKL